MRILVIEDEARILSFLARGLEAEGYRSKARATDVTGSRSRVRERRGTSSCSTCSSPGSTGSTCCDALHRRRPELPVLILSARADLPTKLRGFELGAGDYVPKPVALDELLARIRVQLRRPHRPTTTADSLRGGRLVLDLARRQASSTTSCATCPTASSGCCTTSCCTRAK